MRCLEQNIVGKYFEGAEMHDTPYTTLHVSKYVISVAHMQWVPMSSRCLDKYIQLTIFSCFCIDFNDSSSLGMNFVKYSVGASFFVIIFTATCQNNHNISYSSF